MEDRAPRPQGLGQVHISPISLSFVGPSAALELLYRDREVARRVLAKLGYDVATADGGEGALTFLMEHDVELVVLDMIMSPGIDGCETWRRAQQLRPGLRAIIASGFSESERVLEMQALGAGEYLRKPYTLEQLGLAVRRELGRHR